jgi:hypothetical protein
MLISDTGSTLALHPLDSKEHPYVYSHADEAGNGGGDGHFRLAVDQTLEGGNEEPKLQDEQDEVKEQEAIEHGESLVVAVALRVHAWTFLIPVA